MTQLFSNNLWNLMPSKIFFKIGCLVVLCSLLACTESSDTQKSNEIKSKDTFNSASFDYLFQIWINKSRKDVAKLTPNSSTLFSDDEDYMSFQLKEHDFKHLVVFGYYGNSLSQDFNVEVTFQEQIESITHIYYELRQHNRTQFGNPEKDIEDQENSLLSTEWHIEISGRTGILLQQLEKNSFSYRFHWKDESSQTEGE